MDELPKNKLLEFRPDTLQVVRSECDLDKEKIVISIDLLEDWLKKQTHFVKKSFSREYLERTLVSCKGSVERTKERIDKLCTFRTLMPEYFQFQDVKNELGAIKQFMSAGYLPKMTPDYNRIFISRIEDDTFTPSDVLKLFKYMILGGEYMRRVEYSKRFRIILDYSKINILNIIAKYNPMEFKKIMTIIIEGYGMRVKSVDIISDSKLVDSLISIFKQVVSPKLAGRINVYKNYEGLYKVVPKEILPEEYGGAEKPLRDIFEEWFNTVTSEENMRYVEEMNEAKTVESCRLQSTFNEQYMGTPGSFRAMKID